MKLKFLSILALALLSLSSCEDTITDIQVAKTDNKLVVDGVINDLGGTQTIKISKSQDYTDTSNPIYVTGASVKVTDSDGNVYLFKDAKNNGTYTFEPTAMQKIGKVGRKYTLEVQAEGETYNAQTEMKPVPKIDSLLYQFDEADGRQIANNADLKNGYDAQFYARDFKGTIDCARVKTYKNGKLFVEPAQITLIYDAGLQISSVADGLTYILPARRAISPEIYSEGDKIKVELYSITEEHFYFWYQVRQELSNVGLFARPPANIPTNVKNVNANSSKKAAGWFGASAVSVMETTVEKSKARTGLK